MLRLSQPIEAKKLPLGASLSTRQEANFVRGVLLAGDRAYGSYLGDGFGFGKFVRMEVGDASELGFTTIRRAGGSLSFGTSQCKKVRTCCLAYTQGGILGKIGETQVRSSVSCDGACIGCGWRWSGWHWWIGRGAARLAGGKQGGSDGHGEYGGEEESCEVLHCRFLQAEVGDEGHEAASVHEVLRDPGSPGLGPQSCPPRVLEEKQDGSVGNLRPSGG